MFGFTGNNKLAPLGPPSAGIRAINKKHADMKQSGLDIGPAQSPHQSIDDDGLMRAYKNGRIYWSPQTGAYEVHGGILQKYLKQGETGTDPFTGKRILGFPVTDEVHTLDPQNSTPVSYFQHGGIFWVKGIGAVSVYGKFYSGVNKPVAKKFPHALPIADPIDVAGGQVLHFGHYSLFTGPATDNKIIEIFFSWPQMGKPLILHPKNDFPIAVVVRVEKGAWDAIHKKEPNLLAKIIGNRYVFQGLGKKKNIISIGPANQAPQISPIILQNFPDVLIQTFGYLPDNASKLLESTKDKLTKTKIGNETLNVLSFSPNLKIDHPNPSEKIIFQKLSINRLNNTPSLEDPLPPLDPSLPTNPPLPPPPTDLLRFSLDLSPIGHNKPKTGTLYDVGFRIDSGKVHGVAPHAVYVKDNWTNFGFLHATDIHVSRRIDQFAQKLKTAGKNKGVANLNNWNDAFRDWVRYANHLHDLKMLDVIIATGDLVDYEYEWSPSSFDPKDRSALYSWDPKGGETSNFEFFRQLVLGNVPYPDTTTNLHEELRVPIFTTLGNHDYRNNPYSLLSEIRAEEGLTGLDLGIDLKEVEQYSGFNLTRDEAKILVGGSKPSISPSEAAKALYAPDKYIGAFGPSVYTVTLGPHRIVMMDTGRDAGIFEGNIDALIAWAGNNNEDKNNLADNAPNSVGISEHELELLQKSLSEAGDNGLVIVGLHAPPLNPKGSEYPHYFRETEHAKADKREILSYLRRQSAMPSQSVLADWQLVPKNQVNLSLSTPTQFEFRKTDYFKSGGINNLLDWGIASRLEGETLKLLKMCVGKAGHANRAVDLVLFGHVHRNVEYRLGWDNVRKELRYFMDFYSENPTTYYKSKKFDEAEEVHLRVTNSPTTGKVRSVKDPRPDAFWNEWRELAIPKYADPLNDSKDPTTWWNKHRPLLFQTGPLGPGANQREDKDQNKNKPGPSFQGFRYFKVTNNQIVKMRYVTMATLRKNNFNMPWEEPISHGKPLNSFKNGPSGGVILG